jgi:hypothetical protein
MQVMPNGSGFVVHKILLSGRKGRFSAWFNWAGLLTDAEQILPAGHARPVKQNGPSWRAIQKVGRPFSVVDGNIYRYGVLWRAS